MQSLMDHCRNLQPVKNSFKISVCFVNCAINVRLLQKSCIVVHDIFDCLQDSLLITLPLSRSLVSVLCLLLPACLLACLCACVPAFLLVCLSDCLSACLSVCLCLSTCLSIALFVCVCPPVFCLSVRLFVCLSNSISVICPLSLYLLSHVSAPSLVSLFTFLHSSYAILVLAS